MTGIIPARAGFTARRLRGREAGADHPRSRGVYPAVWVSTMPTDGSSPLARGLRPGPHHGDYPPRIIPARAGFTQRVPARAGRSGDHPRSRGVYATRATIMLRIAGSSPLARGLRARGRRRRSERRIIPARAGFTRVDARERAFPGDHPRSRGVYRSHWSERALATGSSPLARGLRLRLRDHDAPSRIIPARAGFTW